jgi:WD40 repeat protein
MINELFQKIEDKYFRLRGQLGAGRITQQQFETALKDLMFEYEGRYWMIGTNSGQWQVYDGQKWKPAAPPPVGMPTSEPKSAEPKVPTPAKTQGAEIRRFEGHMDEITSVAYSPDGRHALSGDRKGSVRLWNIETGRQACRFQHYDALDINTTWVKSVTFSPCGRYALTGATGGIHTVIRLWEVASGREIRRLAGHRDAVTSVRFSPDGLLAVSGSEDHTARVWEVERGREFLKLEGHTKEVVGVSISPDGKRVLTASQDATFRLWDLQNGRELQRLHLEPPEEDPLITGVAYSPTGFLAVCVTMLGIHVWDLEKNCESRRLAHVDVPLRTASTTMGGNTLCAAFSPDGRHILSGSGTSYLEDDLLAKIGGPDNTVRLWDLNGTQLAVLEGHTANVNSVAFSPDGLRALSGSTDKTVRLWALPQQ